MTDLDPLARAEILARYGRIREAIASLEVSLTKEPNRSDLVLKLQELRAEEAAQRTEPLHVVVGWLLYVMSIATMFLPAWWLTKLLPEAPVMEASGAVIAFIAAAGIAYIVLAVSLALALFHRAWLYYLTRLPAERRGSAEASLQKSMALSVFGARYHALRSRLLR